MGSSSRIAGNVESANEGVLIHDRSSYGNAGPNGTTTRGKVLFVPDALDSPLAMVAATMVSVFTRCFRRLGKGCCDYDEFGQCDQPKSWKLFTASPQNTDFHLNKREPGIALSTKKWFLERFRYADHQAGFQIKCSYSLHRGCGHVTCNALPLSTRRLHPSASPPFVYFQRLS